MSETAETPTSEKKTEPISIRLGPDVDRAVSMQRRLLSENMTDFVDAALRLRLALLAINAPTSLVELSMAGAKCAVPVPRCVANYRRRQAIKNGKGGG